MKDPLHVRIRWVVRNAAEAALLRIFGRPVRCAACGRPMFRGVPLVWRGRVRVFGASKSNYRVAFAAKSELEFRHVELDECPTAERPWAA